MGWYREHRTRIAATLTVLAVGAFAAVATGARTWLWLGAVLAGVVWVLDAARCRAAQEGQYPQ